MHSDSYIFRYAAIMVIVVAAVLSAVAMLLKPAQDKNVAIARMRAILESANIEATAENAIDLFGKTIIEEEVVNAQGEVVAVYREGKLEKGDVRAFDLNLKEELYAKTKGKEFLLPVYIANVDGRKLYIFPLQGRGLWGQIYGNLAMSDDLMTVVGSQFGHDKETPGLGAEIEMPIFEKQFISKTIFDENGNFTSIKVLKNASKIMSADQLVHGVDAISGGTITSNGVSEMIQTNLENYLPFIKNQKQQ
jgi:Na+-transporting NADH:ubiquinone oxidoreductase subunit C